MAKKGLGKGLEALFEDNYLESAEKKEGALKLRVSEIEPNRNQPRKNFDPIALEALAGSMKEHGVLQPILVKQSGDRYQIIAGERRWRAARMAGLSEIPANILELDDQKGVEIALIENMQRENLNPIEEATGIRELMDRFVLTQEQAAQKVGKSRSAVANTLRLLALPESTLALLRDGALSAGHARALLPLEQKDLIEEVAEIIVREELSVRQTEKLVQRRLLVQDGTQAKQETEKNIYLEDLEKQLTEKYSRKIKINDKGKKGSITFEYYGNDDLDALLQALQL